MLIGFTGTQRGLTAPQWGKLHNYLYEYFDYDVCELHHGDCIGADHQAHIIAFYIGIPVVLHPPSNPGKRAWCMYASKRLEERPYLDRNHDIVDDTDLLIACPGEKEEQLRSGTWATIRYATKNKRPVLILYPDGTEERRYHPDCIT